MSSRRLLVLLEHLDDESAFKSALRDDWSEDKYVNVGILNELRIMRADQAAFHDREMEPFIIKSPRQEEADRMDEEHKVNIRTGIMAQLNRNKR